MDGRPLKAARAWEKAMERIRVAVIEEDAMTRAALVEALAGEPDVEIVAQGRDAADAMAATRLHDPDVVLLDAGSSGVGPLVTRAIADRAGEGGPWIVALSSNEDEDAVCMALAAGARAFMPKSRHREELAGVVRAVRAGESYVSPNLAGRLLVGRARRVARAGTPVFASFDERIMRLVSRGLSNREIARRLDLAESVVARCVERVLARIADQQAPAGVVSAHDEEAVARGLA